MLMRVLALRRYLLREVLAPDETNVGVFLPPSVACVATNFALAFSNRVSVNLNYTVTSAALKACSQTAGLKHVITSRKFMEKVELDVGTPVVYLEDLKDKVSLVDKLMAAVNVKLRHRPVCTARSVAIRKKPTIGNHHLYLRFNRCAPRRGAYTYQHRQQRGWHRRMHSPQ